MWIFFLHKGGQNSSKYELYGLKDASFSHFNISETNEVCHCVGQVESIANCYCPSLYKLGHCSIYCHGCNELCTVGIACQAIQLKATQRAKFLKINERHLKQQGASMTDISINHVIL